MFILHDVELAGELISGLTQEDILLSIAFMVAFLAGLILSKLVWERWY